MQVTIILIKAPLLIARFRFGRIGGCIIRPDDDSLLLSSSAWKHYQYVHVRACVWEEGCCLFFQIAPSMCARLCACPRWCRGLLTPVYVERPQWLSRRLATVGDRLKTPLVLERWDLFSLLACQQVVFTLLNRWNIWLVCFEITLLPTKTVLIYLLFTGRSLAGIWRTLKEPDVFFGTLWFNCL